MPRERDLIVVALVGVVIYGLSPLLFVAGTKGDLDPGTWHRFDRQFGAMVGCSRAASNGEERKPSM
jgi:hypothetical protein